MINDRTMIMEKNQGFKILQFALWIDIDFFRSKREFYPDTMAEPISETLFANRGVYSLNGLDNMKRPRNCTFAWSIYWHLSKSKTRFSEIIRDETNLKHEKCFSEISTQLHARKLSQKNWRNS